MGPIGTPKIHMQIWGVLYTPKCLTSFTYFLILGVGDWLRGYVVPGRVGDGVWVASKSLFCHRCRLFGVSEGEFEGAKPHQPLQVLQVSGGFGWERGRIPPARSRLIDYSYDKD